MKRWLIGALAALAFGGGAGSALAQNASAAPRTASSCDTCGVVESVRYVEKQGEASGVGAVAGGIVGGVLGHQIGSGRGNTVATIAGAGAGAYAGHQIEKSKKKSAYYAVTVRLDNGAKKTITSGSRPAFKQGDRVKIIDGTRLALLAN